MGPPTWKVIVVKSMLSLFDQHRWDPASSLKVSMDSSRARLRRGPPLVEWSFLTSHPMFPLLVIQLLPTSPDLSL